MEIIKESIPKLNKLSDLLELAFDEGFVAGIYALNEGLHLDGGKSMELDEVSQKVLKAQEEETKQEVFKRFIAKLNVKDFYWSNK